MICYLIYIKTSILKFFRESNILFLLIGCMLLPLLTSCFTGIESTKKINLSRVDKKLAAPTEEEIFISRLHPIPLQEWERGKRFIVSDDKALLIIVPQAGILPVGPDSIKGKTLEYTGIESKINAAGILTVSILFTDGIYIYAYDTGKEFQDAMEKVKSDLIPMLIDVDLVDQARGLLTGQKVWTKTPLWYDEEGNRIDGKRFVEVTIRDVQPGNLIFPLNVKIQGPDDAIAYVFMNYGNSDNESRSFSNIFTFSDIKKNYPGISPDIWEYICEGKVKIGMTKDECRIALGNPADLTSGHDYSQTLDIWSYENGRVLWFEDGKLVKIRQ